MKKKLLLADDSITIQKVIAITFSSDDYALTVVDNGDVALEKARSDKPDLVLADVFMPGKNGYELCAAIKQDPALAAVPVLLLTGTFEPFDEAKARAVGAEKWIAKPFESQALIDCVEGLLRGAPRSAPTAVVTPAAPVAAPQPPRPVAPAEPAAVAAVPPRPVVPPLAPAVAPVVAAPAPVAPPADDLWGDADSLKADFEVFGGTEGDAGSAVMSSAGDDLWGAVALDELPAAEESALPPLDEDIWGGTETPAGAAGGIPGGEIADQDIWGGFDGDAGAVPAAGEDALLAIDEVEILEEEELSLDVAPPAAAQDPFAFGTADDLSVPAFGQEPAGLSLEWDEPATAAVTPAATAAPAPAPPIPMLEEEFAAPAQAPVAPRPAPRPQATVAPPVEAQVAALSEADLERIVERVAGAVIERLAGTVLEKVAWDVVPDLAESLIKEEIQKIKEAV